MPERPRLVVDTNVLISRLLARNSVAAQAVRKAMDSSQLLVSSETMHELSDVLFRPRFDPYISPADRLVFLTLLRRTALFIDEIETVKACRDPKDDKFLALAVTGRASLILSGDSDLLTLHPFREIEILSPRQYLQR
jgi:putative PIN family toxin of toxin-antitoxin system